MTTFDLFCKRKFLLFVFFVVFSAFTADIFDLREELNILPSPYTDMDNNVTAGMIDSAAVESEPICTWCSVQRKKSLEVSSMYPFPYGFRAPPSLS